MNTLRYFKHIDKLLRRFLWNDLSPRIYISKLHFSYGDGEFNSPDLQLNCSFTIISLWNSSV